jgi:hypothetical protein
MEHPVSPLEAAAALDTVERGRRRIIDEIALPSWYIWGLALSWIALGVVADIGPAWLTSVATFAFGAVHSGVAPRVVGGRRRTSRLTVRADVAPAAAAPFVLGGLVALAALTVAAALAVRADGARHPVTVASVLVATMIVLGGPRLLAGLRARA